MCACPVLWVSQLTSRQDSASSYLYPIPNPMGKLGLRLVPSKYVSEYKKIKNFK